MTTYLADSEHKAILPALRKMGLTDIDASVYICLLERGVPLMGSKVAIRLSLHRQYVYASLQKLLRMGLIEEVPSGARSTYKALPPQYLTTLARKQLEEVEVAARELERVSSIGAEQDFEAYRGTRQVFEFEERFVHDLEDNETQFIIGGSTGKFLEFFGDRYEPISRIAAAKNLKSKYLASSADIKHLTYVKTILPTFEYRVIPNMPEMIITTVIRHGGVTFYSFGNPALVHILRSKTVFEDYKKFFDILWDMAKPKEEK